MNNNEVKVVICDDALCNYLESLQTEIEARQGMLLYMKGRKGLSPEVYDSYHDEYVAYFTEYEKAKKELQRKYVPAGAQHWNLDFDTKEIFIHG